MTRALFALLLLSLSLPAAAQPYLTLGISTAEAKLDGTESRETARPTIGAGYRFTEHLAVEASYLDLGNYSGWTAKGAGLAAIGSLPVGRWSLLGKMGFYSLESERTVTASGSAPGLGTSTTTSNDLGERAVLGIGAAYSLSEKMKVRAMLERVDGKDELDGLRILSVGALLQF